MLHLRDITKRFPGVLALDRVSLKIDRGSCHALLGENGAGKSTLGKVLAGVYQADAGEIRLAGQRIHPATPLAARKSGIAMVHQELAFCPNLTVAENLCLGDFPRRAGWVDRGRMRDRARALLREIETDLDVDLPISCLTTGQEQIVQIAAAVGTQAKVIVMDEPTSSLSFHESQHLFHLLSHLRERQITVLYVSHRMEEIFKLCDTVTVLRDGKHVATEPVRQTSPDRVIHQMIGRELTDRPLAHLNKPLGDRVLEVAGLNSPGRFNDVSFDLHQGEILGLAGLVGAGRSEVAQAIFGLDPGASGSIRVAGSPLRLGKVQDALRAGLGLVPEDRKRQGLVLSLSCMVNGSLASLPELTWAGFIRSRRERALVGKHFARLQVKSPSLNAPIAGLSGGNQQKIALAKWLARHSQVLIVDEPTRGIDVGAKSEIHKLLDELATQGLALLVISSELSELIHLCRRVLVMREGSVVGELPRDELSEPGLMNLMMRSPTPGESRRPIP